MNWNKISHTWKNRFASLIGWSKIRNAFSHSKIWCENLSMYEINGFSVIMIIILIYVNYSTLLNVIPGADWLQGPHVYALFSSYGMTSKQINQLFVVGFGSSMVFGTVVGSFADKMWVLLSIWCYPVCRFRHQCMLLLISFEGHFMTSNGSFWVCRSLGN